MIVQCNDGWFYKDPTWSGPKLLLQTELGDLWLYYQTQKIVKSRALKDAARRLGLAVKSHGMIHWLDTIIGERMVKCSACSLILKSAPPPPSQFVAKVKDCPQESVTETVLRW